MLSLLFFIIFLIVLFPFARALKLCNNAENNKEFLIIDLSKLLGLESPQKVILWLLEMATSLIWMGWYNHQQKFIGESFRAHHRLQSKYWMPYSEYQLVLTHINLTCSLILFENFTIVTVRLSGCSAIEKVWKTSTKYKKVIYA